MKIGVSAVGDRLSRSCKCNKHSEVFLKSLSRKLKVYKESDCIAGSREGSLGLCPETLS